MSANWKYYDEAGEHDWQMVAPSIDRGFYDGTLPAAPTIDSSQGTGLEFLYDVRFLQQFEDAIEEREYMAFGAYTPLTITVGTDVRDASFLKAWQTRIEALWPNFIDAALYSGGFNPASLGVPMLGPTYLSEQQPAGYPVHWIRRNGTTIVGDGIVTEGPYPGVLIPGYVQAGDIIGPWLFERLRAHIESMLWLPVYSADSVHSGVVIDNVTTGLKFIQRLESPDTVPFPQFASVDVHATFTSNAPAQWLPNSFPPPEGLDAGSPYSDKIYNLRAIGVQEPAQFYSNIGYGGIASDVGFSDPATTIAYHGSVGFAGGGKLYFAGVSVYEHDELVSDPALTGGDFSYTWATDAYSDPSPGRQGIGGWHHYSYARPTFKF